MAMRHPRIFLTSSGGSNRMSWPSKMISPETIFPGGLGTSRMIDRFVTDFPEPDSPTIPNVSPRFKRNEMPSTALTTPSSVSKYVRRSLTSRRCLLVELIQSSFEDQVHHAVHRQES